MAKDYKYRAQRSSYANSHSRRDAKKPAKMFWRWLLVIALLIAFVVFLNMIRNIGSALLASKPDATKQQIETKQQPLKEITKLEIPAKPQATPEPEKKAEPQPTEPEEPRYDFYTILPQAETVVPDYEIKTRVREELVGKTKAVKYNMQAGSFRDTSEAEHQKAKLALLGIQARIEKAKVGEAIWYRIKIGPYDNPSSVSTIKELLQKNGFAVIITESTAQ